MTVQMQGATAPMASFFQNSDDPLPPGTEILGKYSVVRTLGKGGMGIVVAARHHGLGELHAIKFLLPNMLVHRQAVQRFEREARAAARLRGEHVARVMDVGRTASGEPYMVMEYLEGRDLRLVLRDGPLPTEDAIEYLLQVCDAVAEAHRSGIVHRDLKPANLFLTVRPNGSPCIKVLDFGIAKISDPSEAEITREGMVGSLKYMSPEQIVRSKTADWRTDIWALGMIAYEFVTGMAPFAATNHLDQISNIMEDEPEPPSRLRPDLPAAIELIIVKCLRKNREERFQSVGELASALREAVGLAPADVPRIRAAMASVSSVTVAPAVVEEKTQRGFGVTEGAGTASRSGWRRVIGVGIGLAMAVLLSLVVLGVGFLWRGRRAAASLPEAASLPIVVVASAVAPEAFDAGEAPVEERSAEPEDVVEQPPAKVVVPNVMVHKARNQASILDAGAVVAAPVESSAAPVTSASSGDPAAGVGAMNVPVKPVPSAAPAVTKTETKVDRGAGLDFD